MANPQGRNSRGHVPPEPREYNNNSDLRSPRISWSVLVMGVGVIVSIVLNYAAYDTRIAVLEKAVVAKEQQITELKHGLRKLETQFSVLSAQQSGTASKSNANEADVVRLDKKVDKMDERLRAEEQKQGKP
ncbi:MAG: hypothetical protein JXR12_01140 [Neptunomonas phycophila]|uniref:hypothetical protein n=1 Tax=Neptunomonas phycophila TaxID=1572645 RepID=UPI003B8B4631